MNEEKEKTEAAGTEDILIYPPHRGALSEETVMRDVPENERNLPDRPDEVSGAADMRTGDQTIPVPEAPESAGFGETSAPPNSIPDTVPDSRGPDKQDPETARVVFPGKGRDLSAEYAELVQAHPELVGNGIPNDVFEEMKSSERPVLSVYDACMLKKQTERISQLEAEVAQLRRNAETAARAPVTGTSGGSVPEDAEDPFIRAFRDYR